MAGLFFKVAGRSFVYMRDGYSFGSNSHPHPHRISAHWTRFQCEQYDDGSVVKQCSFCNPYVPYLPCTGRDRRYLLPCTPCNIRVVVNAIYARLPANHR